MLSSQTVPDYATTEDTPLTKAHYALPLGTTQGR